MKVVHLCNNLWWGSGKAARRLHEGLLAIGVDSQMVVQDLRSDAGPGIVSQRPRGGAVARVRRAAETRLIRLAMRPYASSRPAGADLFVDDRWYPRLSDDPIVRGADIVHLHWVGQSGDSRRFFADLADKPVVWTLHDMLPFTGGCVYAEHCTRYKASCGACPQLGSSRDGDLSREIFERKRAAYALRGPGTRELCITAPSRWLAGCARDSALFRGLRVESIPNGLSTEVFQPRDRAHCRQLLGVPPAAFVVLAGSLSATTTRKGFRYLSEALKTVGGRAGLRPISLLTFGTSWSDDSLPRGLDVVHLGRVEDERLMSCVYSAADVTVLPSLEDNLPLVMLESLACGTPVIGFETGGVPDAVRDAENGLLVARADSAGLARAIERLWADPEAAPRLGRAARERATRDFDLRARARDYADLYGTLR